MHIKNLSNNYMIKVSDIMNNSEIEISSIDYLDNIITLYLIIQDSVEYDSLSRFSFNTYASIAITIENSETLEISKNILSVEIPDDYYCVAYEQQLKRELMNEIEIELLNII